MLKRKAEIMRKPEWLKLKIQGDKNTTVGFQQTKNTFI